MRSLLRAFKPYALGLRRDPATGHLYYPVDGVRLHVRFPAETMRAIYRRRNFEEIYFLHYRPGGDDVVVDIGAGLGTEIVRLAALERNLRYIAVEIQPWVFECLCLTLAQLPAGYVPFGLAIGGGTEVRINPTREGEDASIIGGGPVPVPMVSWPDFVHRHGIDQVDLLKMNVEGAEADLLSHIDLRQVRRVLVNVHDFRADRGESEGFRTRALVEDRLLGTGFSITAVAEDWIYAERR
ncbi:MAG TPA: FkbM family methyltransferase [Allosphingosinicella sp.]|nr:FkbM family methyltransferase [Allosphingosinicella sp.]